MTSPSPDTDLVERLVEAGFRRQGEYTRYEYAAHNATVEKERATKFARGVARQAVIEALTAQQQEPVGEVEVVAWRWRRHGSKEWASWTWVKICPDWLKEPEFEIEPLIRLSDHQRVVAERDAEIYKLRLAFDAMSEEVTADEQRAIDAEARISTLEAQLVEARGALRPFVEYTPELCFKGNGRYRPMPTDEPGGGWYGAEDFRRARAALNKEGGAA